VFMQLANGLQFDPMVTLNCIKAVINRGQILLIYREIYDDRKTCHKQFELNGDKYFSNLNLALNVSCFHFL
jgi:hypothetical protein